MFTGLIKDIGTLKKITPTSFGKCFVVETDLTKILTPDASLAVNGTCLTVTKIENKTVTLDLIHITLEKTNLGNLYEGDLVNLEPALRVGDPLGGHFVQGHVNGVIQILKIEARGGNYEFTLNLPKEFRKYLISEGSIALDGISLTIAKLAPDNFTVSIIPYTFEHTNFGRKKVGDSVNLEVDMLAKYMENFAKYHD